MHADFKRNTSFPMENNTPLNTYGIKCPMKRNVGIAYNLYYLFIGNSYTENLHSLTKIKYYCFAAMLLFHFYFPIP